MDGDRRYEPTPGQRFADAVWAAPDEDDGGLSTMEAFMALAYAKATRPGADTAWLTQRQLRRWCKIASHSTIVKTRKALIEKGWLVPIDVMFIRGGKATLFRLLIPESGTRRVPGEQQSGTRAVPGRSESGTAGVPGDEKAVHELYQVDDLVHEVYQVDTQPGTAGVPLSQRERYTVHSKAVHDEAESGTPRVPGSPDYEPPVGGAQSGASAAARGREHAREAAARKAAPQTPNGASTNGYAPKEQTIDDLRKLLVDRGRRK